MLLDTSTLYLVATLVAVMLGAMLLYFGRHENIAALSWWGSAYLLGGVSVGLWTLAGPLLGELPMLALNAIGFVACGMVWTAARVFHGRSPIWGGVFFGAMVWIATIFALAPEATQLRTTIGAGIVAFYAVLTAYELALERRKSVQQRWPTALVPLLHGFVLMLPILVGDFLQADGATSGSNFGVTAFAIELVLYAIGTVFLIFVLVSERTVAAHKVAASCDPLTGLFNRRGFSEATGRMIEREAKAGRPVTVMIFDIDHFKSINDRFGHPAGDEVLKLFATVIQHSLRITDLTGRIGGEEFAALLPCSLEEAMQAAERVRQNFAGCGIEVDDAPVATTVSIGVAGGPAGTELDVLLAAADTALYQAKRGGRNRVQSAAEEPLSLAQGRKATAGGQPKPTVRLTRTDVAMTMEGAQ
ncbi:MAG: GGDEF domain-containing protein [Bradyrhizobiaceae bacterium]|jgi:diguanylate cyclase (GGDEF)-like protein|nr:MAG: GGDEF domain-containing protein [Bradyrhizobiaceae bacterium]